MKKESVDKKKGIWVSCPRCKHSWIYRGVKQPTDDFPQYISCGRCHYGSIKLEVKK